MLRSPSGLDTANNLNHFNILPRRRTRQLLASPLSQSRKVPSAASAVVYRVLPRLFQTRDEEPARSAAPPPTFIFIDEVTTSRRRTPEKTSTRRWWRL